MPITLCSSLSSSQLGLTAGIISPLWEVQAGAQESSGAALKAGRSEMERGHDDGGLTLVLLLSDISRNSPADSFVRSKCRALTDCLQRIWGLACSVLMVENMKV